MVQRTKKPASESARVAEIEQHCIARNAGACTRTGDCLACSPVEQSLRTASWALARWPHVGKPGARRQRAKR